MSRITDMLRAVCLEFGITRDQLVGRSKQQHFIAARRKFCHDSRAAGLSIGRIAQILERDHSTVVHHLSLELIRLPPRPRPTVRSVRKVVAASMHKADYTAEEIDRMTTRRLGRAWD